MRKMQILLSVSALAITAFSYAGGPPQGDPTLFEFKPSENGQTRIDIWPNGRAERPVSRYLYGKFTEHLWWNVYNGLWAQILKNPGFESWELLGEGGERVEEWFARTDIRQQFPKLGENKGAGTGVAPWWLPLGEDWGHWELDSEAFNSGHSQKISTDFVGSGVGVEQPIFLPLHREDTYELSFYGKGEGSLEFSIRTPEKTIASHHINIRGAGWDPHFLILEVDRASVPAGAPLLLRIEMLRPGTVWLDQVFLFPEDHAKGFDPEVVRMLRDSKLPLLRFPGGNFVSGYNWEDGIGPLHERPTSRNPAWGGFESNHVGTDEYMAFCDLVGCEPLICVNAGNGSAEEAARWVEYCNGSTDTKYGALRAKNGHPQPYNVKLWEVGNELYGNWQIGHATAEEYARRYQAFHAAMSKVDPDIQFLAIGQNTEWISPLLAHNGSSIRSLAVHELPGGRIPADAPPAQVFQELMAFPASFREKLHEMSEKVRAAGLKPTFALTEAQIFTNKPSLPTNDTLSEALFLAGLIHMAIREGDLVEMITHSALVNHGGGLRKQRERVYATPVHYASHLYGTQTGVYPVRLKVESASYESPGRFLPETQGKQIPVLDAVALASDTGDEITLIVANLDAKAALTAQIAVHEANVAQAVTVRSLEADSFMARNSWDDPEKVRLVEKPAQQAGGQMTIRFAPHSLTALVFRAQQ